MKINAFSNNISFKKTLAANCAVLNQNGQKENCKIYKIDPYEDENYFKDLKNDDIFCVFSASYVHFSDLIPHVTFMISEPRNISSLARETWREICVSVADIFHMQISAHPRGAFISVGDCNPD